MKKLALCSLVLLLLAAVVFAGCGSNKDDTSGSKSSGDLSAKQIIEESSKQMQTVKSVKAEGTYNMSTSGSSPSTESTTGTTSGDMEFNFEMEMNLSDPAKPEMKMVMTGTGTDTIMYMTGGYAYTEVEGQGWVKAPVGDSGSVSQASPAEIAKFADNAENLRIVSESGNKYVISFDISDEMIKEQMESEQDMSELSKEMQGIYEDMLKNMKMSAIFTIDKQTMYINKAIINMSVKDFPMVGDMTLDMTMKFKDFNEPVTVSLPAEAANAQETTESTSSTGGLLPGFGF